MDPEINHADCRWELRAVGATEGQTFYVTAKDGSFGFVQLVYTTINSWNPSAQLTCRLFRADGTKYHKTYSYWGSSFQLSEDKRSAQCEHVKITWSPDPGFFHVVVQDAPELIVDFKFEPIDRGFQVGDGMMSFKDEKEAGHVISRFFPMAKVKGSMLTGGQHSDLEGSGLFVHALQCNPQCCSRWNFVNFQNEKDSIMLYQFELPDGYGYTKSLASRGSLVLNNKTVAVTIDNCAKLVETQYDSFSGYQIPTLMDITWSGKSFDGEDVKIHMNFQPQQLRDKLDILGEITYLLRVLIQTFITKPFVYQWFQPGKAEVTIGERKFEVDGSLFFENTFLMSV
ncbi:oxidative stress survival, Svf1-like protein [Cladochytrium replicatum]|nr:oxidative stress survival, Svf1-like protein [Cladochytrium replicatum]